MKIIRTKVGFTTNSSSAYSWISSTTAYLAATSSQAATTTAGKIAAFAVSFVLPGIAAVSGILSLVFLIKAVRQKDDQGQA